MRGTAPGYLFAHPGYDQGGAVRRLTRGGPIDYLI